MKKPTKKSWADRLRTAFMSKDADAAEAIAKELETKDSEEEEEEESTTKKTGDSKTLDSILKAVTTLSKRVGDMEAEFKKSATDDDDEDDEDDEDMTQDDVLKPEEAAHVPDASGKTYTGDSAAETTAWADLRSRAEILAPGITFPTRDSKTKFADAMCSCQRQALSKAMQTADGKAAVETFLFGRQLSALTADQVASAFAGASELVKASNNAAGNRAKTATNDFGRPGDVASINASNQKFWNRP